MKFHFCDTNKDVTDALTEQFGDSVSVTLGRFEDVEEFDAVVTPGNSFGIMDGGFDLAVRNYFGMSVQDEVQKNIHERYFNEQPVGTSFIVPTGNAKHPWLIHSPTMPAPQPIYSTHNVYHAMLATLHAIQWHNIENLPVNEIETILCPGLGTACGQMMPKVSAGQIYSAIRNFRDVSKEPRTSWDQFKPKGTMQ